MSRWKIRIGLILLGSFLLPACGAWMPLATEDEVLAWLSERYGGTEFVILETLDGSVYERKDRPKAQLHRVAPAENQTQAFWVFSAVEHYSRGPLPSYYGHDLEDTYAFDYFLAQFDGFLQENLIHGFFRSGNTQVDMADYLSKEQFHSQGGHFLIYVTKENAMDIIRQVFEFVDSFYAGYPYPERLEELRLIIYFADEASPIQDGEEAPDKPIKRGQMLYEKTYCYPFEYQTKYNDAQSVLKAVNELFYGIVSE